MRAICKSRTAAATHLSAPIRIITWDLEATNLSLKKRRMELQSLATKSMTAIRALIGKKSRAQVSWLTMKIRLSKKLNPTKCFHNLYEKSASIRTLTFKTTTPLFRQAIVGDPLTSLTKRRPSNSIHTNRIAKRKSAKIEFTSLQMSRSSAWITTWIVRLSKATRSVSTQLVKHWISQYTLQRQSLTIILISKNTRCWLVK